jgi:hypothetical protein
MDLLRIVAAAGAMTIAVMGCAFSHTYTKHYAPHASHKAAHHEPSKKTWHSAKPFHGKTISHPPGHGHGHHAPKAPHSRKHHWTGHKTYHRPPPPRPMPGKTSDGRYMLPGGMESVCAGGTPPPCQ